jgi:hypothetical protein
MLLVEGFQKFAGIPLGISRIFESLMPQQKKEWGQVNYLLNVGIFTFYLLPVLFGAFT